MEDQITTPVSMVGAGIMPPQQPPVDIGGILGSMPQIPAMAPPVQANPGLAAFSGLQAGLQGQGAVNPYLAQQQQMANQAADQTLRTGYLGLNIQRMQQEQARFKERQNAAKLEALGKVSMDLMKSDNPDAALVGAKGFQGYARQIGLDVPDDIVKAIAQRRLTTEQGDKIMTKMVEGADDPTIIKMFPNIDPGSLAGLRQMAGNDDTRHRLGFKTQAESAAAEADLKLKNLKMIQEQYPELKLSPMAAMIHEQLNNGKQYSEGTSDSRMQAIQIAKAKQAAMDFEAKKQELDYTEKLRSQLQEQRDTAAEGRLVLRAQLAQDAKDKAAKDKKMANIAATETFLNQAEAMIPKLDKGGWLPKDGGVAEAARTSLKRGDNVMIPGVSAPNDPLWRQWLDLQGNMIGFARSVQNDIGPRAMAVFQQAVNVSAKPPTAEGLRNIFKQMRQQLEASKRGEPLGPETPVGPTSPASPLAPAAPAAAPTRPALSGSKAKDMSPLTPASEPTINRGQPNFYFPKGTPERQKLDAMAPNGDFDSLPQKEKETLFSVLFPGQLGHK